MLTARSSTVGHMPAPFQVRLDDVLLCNALAYARRVPGDDLRPETMKPHWPKQSGIIERVTRA